MDGPELESQLNIVEAILSASTRGITISYIDRVASNNLIIKDPTQTTFIFNMINAPKQKVGNTGINNTYSHHCSLVLITKLVPYNLVKYV